MSIDAQTLRSHLFTACEQAGGVRAWSRRTSVPVSLVSRTLNGLVEPGETVANALGYIRTVAYAPIRSVRPPPPRPTPPDRPPGIIG